MKKLFLLPLFLFLFLGAAFSQQATIRGKWSGAFPGEDGQLMAFAMTITDSTYEFDFNGDGVAELTGSYIGKGNQITIWNTSADNECPADKKGVYQYAFDGDNLTFTKVSDDCPGRGGEPLVLKRM